ncbi:MAG TPA: aminotransferase class V-fold PLP-dependent enzyme [Myxococcota bacterium]|nr:aminotransferase class V-fold PLP-dependent enzyme [Myxococcota bacterium]
MKPAIPKELFDLDGITWLLHCAEGPTPAAVADSARRYMDLEVRPWNRLIGRDVVDILNDARKQAATLVSGPFLTASCDDITLSQSTSSGLTLVAQAYPFKPGDEVLAPMGEFPSNVWPWKALSNRGVSFREVPLWDGHQAGRHALDSTPPTADARPEERIAAAISSATRIVTVSWVRFQDGLMLDLNLLGRLCADRGVDLVVDGIQGAGTHAPDLSGVAAFAAGGHKGLLAMSGQGFLWTSPGFRQRLSPMGSWLSVEEGGNFNRAMTDHERGWLATGQRMEQGGYNILGSLVLKGALAVLNETGVCKIESHVSGLQTELLAGLRGAAAISGPFSTSRGRAELERLEGLVKAGRTGPIVCLHHHERGPAFLESLAEKLRARSIFVSTREGYLRIAFHGWHDSTDVGAVVNALS